MIIGMAGYGTGCMPGVVRVSGQSKEHRCKSRCGWVANDIKGQLKLLCVSASHVCFVALTSILTLLLYYYLHAIQAPLAKLYSLKCYYFLSSHFMFETLIMFSSFSAKHPFWTAAMRKEKNKVVAVK